MKIIGKSGKRGRESEAEMKWLVKEGKEQLIKKSRYTSENIQNQKLLAITTIYCLMYSWLCSWGSLIPSYSWLRKPEIQNKKFPIYIWWYIPSPTALFISVLPPESAPEKVHNSTDSISWKSESHIYCPKSLLLLSGALQFDSRFTANGVRGTKPNIGLLMPQTFTLPSRLGELNSHAISRI